MERTFLLLASISGGLAVALGAFGAHALRGRLGPEQLETFKTRVNYQMSHALALLVVALALPQWPNAGLVTLSGWLFVAGTLLFSGSLYLLTWTRVRAWGAVTPLGGVAFIAGWLVLALAATG